MQCGLGYGQEQFDAMGVDIKHRPSMFEQSLDIVRRLLAGETVTATGRFTITRATVAPRPPEPVEVWIGASAEPAIDRAARLADGFLAAPGLSLPQAAAQAALYAARAKVYGRTPTAVAIRRDIYVAESPAEAKAVLGDALAKGYRGIAEEALIAGTVEEVIARFRALGELGYTDVIVRHLTNDQPRVLASLGRLEQVRRALASA
jgi:alkanesulfonate monooxygenase SsuD/methylene tetrahydromethanopterin reductase-like flavin-dependent oxidoreductase (luciferase family)